MITFNSSTRLPGRARVATAAVALLLCGSVAPASAGNLCVSMADSGGQVAGIQVDFKWDSSCMSPDQAGGTGVRCTAESSTGKDIRAGLNKAGQPLKAIFFSMADTSPIPDGDLFCCSFTRSSSGGNPCCGLTMGNVLGSDSVGHAIQANAFTLSASLDGVQCALSQATSGSGGQQRAVGGGLQGGAGGVAPPVVSAPGVAAPVQQGPAGGGQPAAPAGRAAMPEVPAGMDQVQRALEQLAPREAPTTAAEPTAPAAVTTPQPLHAAGTPTAKAHATAVHGTPTAAAKATPSAATTPHSKTPAKTPAATPEATPKAKPKHEERGN